MKIKYRIFSGIGPRNRMEDLIHTISSCGRFIQAVVCDGHGSNGSLAASEVCEAAKEWFLKKDTSVMNGARAWRSAPLKRLFASMDRRITKKLGDGTGVVTTMLSLHADVLNIAHAGDIEVWIKRRGASCRVSDMHRVTDGNELARLVRNGAMIHGPYFVTDGHALQPTRSIGDSLFRKVGHTCAPQVAAFRVRRGDLVIAATDGVWDIIDEKSLNGTSGDLQSCARWLKSLCARSTHDNYAALLIKVQ